MRRYLVGSYAGAASIAFGAVAPANAQIRKGAKRLTPKTIGSGNFNMHFAALPVWFSTMHIHIPPCVSARCTSASILPHLQYNFLRSFIVFWIDSIRAQKGPSQFIRCVLETFPTPI